MVIADFDIITVNPDVFFSLQHLRMMRHKRLAMAWHLVKE
jgi:hypothetical protein